MHKLFYCSLLPLPPSPIFLLAKQEEVSSIPLEIIYLLYRSLNNNSTSLCAMYYCLMTVLFSFMLVLVLASFFFPLLSASTLRHSYLTEAAIATPSPNERKKAKCKNTTYFSLFLPLLLSTLSTRTQPLPFFVPLTTLPPRFRPDSNHILHSNTRLRLSLRQKRQQTLCPGRCEIRRDQTYPLSSIHVLGSHHSLEYSITCMDETR